MCIYIYTYIYIYIYIYIHTHIYIYIYFLPTIFQEKILGLLPLLAVVPSEAVACDATALTQFTALSDDAMVLELLKHRHEARKDGMVIKHGYIVAMQNFHSRIYIFYRDEL